MLKCLGSAACVEGVLWHLVPLVPVDLCLAASLSWFMLALDSRCVSPPLFFLFILYCHIDGLISLLIQSWVFSFLFSLPFPLFFFSMLEDKPGLQMLGVCDCDGAVWWKTACGERVHPIHTSTALVIIKGSRGRNLEAGRNWWGCGGVLLTCLLTTIFFSLLSAIFQCHGPSSGTAHRGGDRPHQ